LAEVEDRGVQDVLTVCCGGLRGLPDAVWAVWGQAVVRTCVIRLLGEVFECAARRDWGEIAGAVRPVCEAAAVGAAEAWFVWNEPEDGDTLRDIDGSVLTAAEREEALMHRISGELSRE
jgi:transposase-like protein